MKDYILIWDAAKDPQTIKLKNTIKLKKAAVKKWDWGFLFIHRLNIGMLAPIRVIQWHKKITALLKMITWQHKQSREKENIEDIKKK